jgi:MFS family permease
MRASMLAVTLPLGWLQDRVGAVRLSCLAFSLLTLYPVLLLTSSGVTTLALASVVFGFGMAGVQFGWMLGPVALAGTPEKVPQYVAIHATLVGVRGILFQGLGMAFYKLTGSFFWPLLAATITFAWAAWQMWQLQDALRTTATPGPNSVAPPTMAVPPAVPDAPPPGSLAGPSES